MEKAKFYKIVHDDESLLIVNKKAGIPVITDRSGKSTISLFNILKNRFKELKLVHRIDRNTSGLVVFAKTTDSQRALSEQFSNRVVEKFYLALVEGRCAQEEWTTIDAPIFKSSKTFKVFIHSKGKNAISLYKTLEVFDQASLVKVKILSGRTHQIRVHLAHIGYPLLVDFIYGNNDAFYLSELLKRKYKRKTDKAEKPLISRQTLHAHEIKFLHPATGKHLHFEAALPKDFNAVLNQLRRI